MITLNAQSIQNHTSRIVLQQLLDTHKPDAMTLCETWLDTNHRVVLTGYDIERADRNSRGGGLAIITKKNTEKRRIDLIFKPTTFEVMATAIFHIDGSSTILLAIYKKPETPFSYTEWDNVVTSLPQEISTAITYRGKVVKHLRTESASMIGQQGMTSAFTLLVHLQEVYMAIWICF